MTTYVDSSVLVRIVAGQARPLRDWDLISAPLASVLIEVETPRAIERLRAGGQFSIEAAAGAVTRAREALRTFQLMEIDYAVRLRASGPLGANIRTLDAIHLATALLWREANPDAELVMATHDERVARASMVHGFTVIGWPDG